MKKIFFCILLSVLWGCNKPPTKLKKLLAKYPELLKQDTIVKYDTITIDRVEIQTVILPKTDTIEIQKLVVPIRDSLQRIIVTKNIYKYLERLRKIDTAITVQDLNVSIYTDSLGNLKVFATRNAREEIKGTQVVMSGYVIENKTPPWYKSPILKYLLILLIISLIILWKIK